MRIVAIDPGTTKSAYVVYETVTKKIEDLGKVGNETMRDYLRSINGINAEHLAIEMIASYGMAVGRSVFETCVWLGQFIEAWEGNRPGQEHTKVYRLDVKMYLCHSTRAKDGNIRQAILDRYEASGGGRTPQIGIKSQPGPLFGVSQDIWSALAVAITWAETNVRAVRS